MEKEYKFTIKKLEHLRGKQYIEFKDGRVNRGLEYKGDNKDMLELREQIMISWANHLYKKTKGEE